MPAMNFDMQQQTRGEFRGDANLGDIIYKLSVNFLLYVTLIIVFYMLVRFYLEEETFNRRGQYAAVATTDDGEDELPSTELETATSDRAELIETKNKSTQPENDAKSHQMTAVERPVGMARSGSFLNLNEWGEPEGTKQEVIQRAVVCALGLNVSFAIWGLAQERILTMTYDGDFFEFSYGLVFINRLSGLILSAFLMYYFRVEWVSSALWEYSFPSVANMLSSWCQYEALKYVSFPMVMLAKAFKMVPIMLMGRILNNKTYEAYEYVTGATVGFGLYLFLGSSEKLDLKQNVFGDPENVTGAMCGVVLLILFLCFDSFTGQWQTRMFQLNKRMSPLQMMLIMNAFSAVFSFITLVHQEELNKSMGFVYDHPHMLLHLSVFCICSTVGQLFIFYTVKSFGAVVFAIIMSIRILLSTILSCAVYSHPITEMGFIGMFIVFAAVAYRIKRKTEGSSLIRWKETDKPSGAVFKHWHEHLDF